MPTLLCAEDQHTRSGGRQKQGAAFSGSLFSPRTASFASGFPRKRLSRVIIPFWTVPHWPLAEEAASPSCAGGSGGPRRAARKAAADDNGRRRAARGVEAQRAGEATGMVCDAVKCRRHPRETHKVAALELVVLLQGARQRVAGHRPNPLRLQDHLLLVGLEAPEEHDAVVEEEDLPLFAGGCVLWRKETRRESWQGHGGRRDGTSLEGEWKEVKSAFPAPVTPLALWKGTSTTSLSSLSGTPA